MSGDQILIRHGVDLKAFREEILPANEPVVLKDLVKDWPAVKAGLRSARALGNYLRGFDRGKPVAVLEGPPSIRGRFFYREYMRELNFERARPPSSGCWRRSMTRIPRRCTSSRRPPRNTCHRSRLKIPSRCCQPT